jgi:hypothetical protein
VRSWHQKTCWKTTREGYDDRSSKFPSVVKQRFIKPVGERTKLRRLMPASFVTLWTMAPGNLSACSFSPVATWNLHTTQPSTLSQLTMRLWISPVCYKQRIKRIEW